MPPHNLARREDAADPKESKAAPAEVTRLTEANLPYAHAIAAEVSRKLPLVLERKDIQGWAELGLVEAAKSFDPTRGIQFKTFAYYRIKGAIYDGLRKMGWYPKGQYQKLRFEMAANEYLQDVSTHALPPTSAENQLQDLKDVTANVMSCYMLSLEAMPQEPVDTKQVSAEETMVRNQQRSKVRLSLAQLPERNRRVLELFYFEDLTLEEIGKKLGLSKSWVCRLHAKSLELLRKQLNQLLHIAGSRTSATFSGIIR
ncbi:MAG TPA: sigma-70 family RNA polymerase sigma factor [Terriglobales bacterium]|nr:sigma-70 family RNA polymerase sigma factor [Terriglobales bacterium]